MPGAGAPRGDSRQSWKRSAPERSCGSEHFSDCVLHDRPFRYPAEEAALNLRTIEALYRSARDGGRPVVL